MLLPPLARTMQALTSPSPSFGSAGSQRTALNGWTGCPPPPSHPWTYRHLHHPSTFALQALNVLLQSNPDAAKGFTAKVADFGLSVQMSKAETHVSGLYQVGRMEEEGRVGGDEIWETGWCVDWVRWLGRKASPTSRVAGWYLLLSQVSLYCPYDLCGRGRPLHSLVSLFMH